MTKRNLLLVSLLLVIGLAATGPCLFAQAVFDISNNTNFYVRNEGDAEGVGTITLSTTSTGTIGPSSGFYITYNVPLAHYGTIYAVDGWCTGADAVELCTNLTVSFAANPITLKYNNELILTYVSTGTTLTGAGGQINFSVRIQAQGLVYNTPINASVRAFYTTPAYALTISPAYPNNFEVAAVGPGPATTTTFHKGPAYVLTCVGVNRIKGTAYDDDFNLRISENWPDALTSLSDEYNLENDSVSGAPTNGSNILITLSGIPTGVTVTAGLPWPCEDISSTSPDYCSGGELLIEAPVTVSPGVFSYQVDKTNVTVTEWADFGFKLSTTGPLPPNQSYSITALISLIPTTLPSMPYFTATEGPAFPVVDFFDCTTKLLFPYINTYTNGTSFPFGNFGTGVVFANTTWDPFALPGTTYGSDYLYPDEEVGSATPQSGNCLLYLYPYNEGAYTLITTPTISAGGSWAFDVGSTTPTAPTPAFSGTYGYGIAICNFSNAYGFAEIYDNFAHGTFLGAPTATLAYLAYILPDPAFYHRTPAGDGLGEEAIAPININHWFLKLMMLGKIPSFLIPSK